MFPHCAAGVIPGEFFDQMPGVTFLQEYASAGRKMQIIKPGSQQHAKVVDAAQIGIGGHAIGQRVLQNPGRIQSRRIRQAEDCRDSMLDEGQDARVECIDNVYCVLIGKYKDWDKAAEAFEDVELTDECGITYIRLI